MPTMTNQPTHYSDPSQLTAGVHPAYLVAVTEEFHPRRLGDGESAQAYVPLAFRCVG